MYKFSYAEILEEGGEQGREREQQALDHALELLNEAQAHGPQSQEGMSAINYLQKVWNFLIEDLASPGNALGDHLRADLISIGIWVIREADRLLTDPSGNFTALIEVNTTIRDGLK